MASLERSIQGEERSPGLKAKFGSGNRCAGVTDALKRYRTLGGSVIPGGEKVRRSRQSYIKGNTRDEVKTGQHSQRK